MIGFRRLVLASGVAVLLALSGCATAPKPPQAPSAAGPWSGRLALQVDGDASQSFSAAFELKGDARNGELSLLNPLGSTVAQLEWSPSGARLRSGKGTREFPSAEALVSEVTGAPLPVAALFDWLRGVATPVAGWQANLSQLADGRLSAHRTEPAPAADLRVVLDR